MKKIALVMTLVMCQFSFGVWAQTAKEVLDKCAAAVSSKEGVQASFTMVSAQYGSASGTISVKGQMFNASTAAATMWFDGKTLWTYMAKNNEVNVTTPSQQQLQTLNPYNFINLYKKGFKYTMTKSDAAYNVHLTGTDVARNVKEMFITVDKKTWHPTEVKLRQGSRWTTFTVSDLKSVKLADGTFRFNSKDFPTAEVIDLR